jgi:hypothetical protein
MTSHPHITFVLFFLAVAPIAALAQTTSPDPNTTPQDADSSAAAAYQFKNEGIFGCNQVAGANASAGTMAAIGGVYVPVNDAAVTLNTGILVYKECVLRPLQDRLRESAMSALFKKGTVSILTAREGNPQHLVNRGSERKQVGDKTFLAVVTDPALLDALNPAFRDVVRSATARNYQSQTRSPESQLKCDYRGDINALLRGEADAGIAGLQVLLNPACNPADLQRMLDGYAQARVTQAVSDWETTLAAGRDFYPITDNAANPLDERILTPAATVQESYQTLLDSPVHQLESANDIGQMIGALFAGVSTHIISDSRGLAGLMQGAAGQPSYLEQVAKESSQGVIGAAVNAALSILNASRGIETRYLSAMNSVASTLTQTINQLRAGERACWDLIVPRAADYAGANNFQIQPATSTVFSQQVIDSQITALAQAALINIQNSQRALGLIDQLIAGVTNTASLNAQRLALQQLDNLVAQRQLHTQFDAQNAEKQRDDVASAMETLRTDTIQAWGDSTDPQIGWCNINNASIPQLWAERWRR